MSIEEIRGATPVSGTKKGGDKEKKINKWKKKKNMATVKEGTKTKVSEKMQQIEEMNDSSKSKTKRAPPKLNVKFFDKTSASKGLSEGEDKNLSTEERAQSKRPLPCSSLGGAPPRNFGGKTVPAPSHSVDVSEVDGLSDEGQVESLSRNPISSMKGSREKEAAHGMISLEGRQGTMHQISSKGEANIRRMDALEKDRTPRKRGIEYDVAAHLIGSITSDTAPNMLTLPSRPAMTPLPRRPLEADPMENASITGNLDLDLSLTGEEMQVPVFGGDTTSDSDGLSDGSSRHRLYKNAATKHIDDMFIKIFSKPAKNKGDPDVVRTGSLGKSKRT